MRFRFDPLSRVFLYRCIFDENALRGSVDGRGMTHRNVCVFRRKPISGRGLRITANDICLLSFLPYTQNIKIKKKT